MKQQNIHIIGGGIIGLCSAWFLEEAGWQVTVIDRGSIQEGTSFGNAGMVVPSHFIPMAAPGVIKQGFKWMLNSKSPFYIRPRWSWELARWLWLFYRSANPKQVKEAIPVLYAFNAWSKDLYRNLQEKSGLDFGYKEQGLLMLYHSAKQEKKEKELAAQAHEIGIPARLLSNADLQELDPGPGITARGGLYFPSDAHLNPNQLMLALKEQLINKGVQFKFNCSIYDFSVSNGNIDYLQTAEKEKIKVDQVLVCAGAWTANLLKRLAVKMLLQDGKGYSLTFSELKNRPKIPTILSEAKVAITPMGKDLRVGGTLELSGLSAKVNQQRVSGILESIPQYYQHLELPDNSDKNIWQGYRPCTPDGMPYIGRSNSIANLSVNTGHGMMGLSLGAASGKLISEILTRKTTSIPSSLFRLDRFQVRY